MSRIRHEFLTSLSITFSLSLSLKYIIAFLYIAFKSTWFIMKLVYIEKSIYNSVYTLRVVIKQICATPTQTTTRIKSIAGTSEAPPPPHPLLIGFHHFGFCK